MLNAGQANRKIESNYTSSLSLVYVECESNLQGDPYVMDPYSVEIRAFFEFYHTNGL